METTVWLGGLWGSRARCLSDEGEDEIHDLEFLKKRKPQGPQK